MMMKKLLLRAYPFKQFTEGFRVFAVALFSLTLISIISFGQGTVTQTFNTATANSVNATNWAAGTAYTQHQYVYSSGNLYKVYIAGTSTATAPTGTGTGSSSTAVGTTGASFEYIATIPLTQTWTCPTGVTSIDVEVWGAGGGGGSSSAAATGANRSGGGGGGGSYLKQTFTVVPNTTYNLIVGLGGFKSSTSSANGYFGGAGGKSEFSGGSVTTLTASGGTGGSGGTSSVLLGFGGVLGGVYGYSVSGTKSISYTSVATLSSGNATAIANTSSSTGIVSYIAATSQGNSYTSAPTVSVGSGAGQIFTAFVNPNINSAGYSTISVGLNGGDATASKGGDGGASQAGIGSAGGSGTVLGTSYAASAAINVGSGGGGGFSVGGTGSATGAGGAGANGQVTITYSATITTYTYKGTGELNDVTNWVNSSNANPVNFSSDFQIFKLKNNAITTTPWTVSGISSKIVVGDPASAGVTLTIDTLKAITGTIDITAASTGSNSLVLEDAILSTSPLVLGSLHANSEVHYRAKGSIYGAFTYGKLFVDGGLATDTVSFYGTPHKVVTSFNIGTNSMVYLSSTSTNYLDVSSAAVTIAGNVSTPRVNGFVSSNVTLGSANAALQFSGAENLTLSPGSTIEFQRGITSTQTTTQTITPRSDYKNLKLTGVFAPKVFGTGTTTVSGVLTLNSGVATTTLTNLTPIVIASTGTLALTSGVLTGSGNITFSNGAKISKADGSLDVAPVFAGGASVEYNGTTAATIGVELPSSLNNLTINNAAGVSLIYIFNVSGTLALTKGILTIPSGKILTLSSGGTFTGGSATSYINTQGSLNVTGISTLTNIPVGYGSNYLPISLTPNSASDFSVNVFNGATQDGTLSGAAIADKTNIVDAIWNVNRTSGTGNCAVTLAWPAALKGSNFAALANAKIGIARYNGSVYSSFGGSGNQSANTATQSFGTLGPLSVGTITTLPVKLISFTGKAVNNNVSLNWQATSEVNLAAYVVQRSTNGQDFETLTSLKAKNTAGVFDYGFTDYTTKFGVNYYRLLSVDIDGTSSISNPIAVSLGASTLSVTAYPNPATQQLNVTGLVAGDHIKLLDLAGKTIKTQDFSGSSAVVLSLDKINVGMYLLVVENAGRQTFQSKIVKN